MAEGALSGVAKGIIGKAGDLVVQEIALIWGVKDETMDYDKCTLKSNISYNHM